MAKKVAKSKYRVFRDPNSCGWKLVIEGARTEDCPMLFTDEWIASVNDEQRRMILSVLEEYQI